MKLTTWALGLALVGAGSAASAQTPTFSTDVAPIVFAKCAGCHRPGEVAPMSLTTFKEVRPWASAIKEKVSTRAMPPWHADRAYNVSQQPEPEPARDRHDRCVGERRRARG